MWFLSHWYVDTKSSLHAQDKSHLVIVLLVVVIQSVSPNLCDPMDCSTAWLLCPALSLEFAQIHVHWVGDFI